MVVNCIVLAYQIFAVKFASNYCNYAYIATRLHCLRYIIMLLLMGELCYSMRNGQYYYIYMDVAVLQRAKIARAYNYTVHLLCFLQLSSQYSHCQWREPRDWRQCSVVNIKQREWLSFIIGQWTIPLRADTETVRVRPPSSPGGSTTLTILATPQHNNSDVQCVARVLDGIDIVRSGVLITATLTV